MNETYIHVVTDYKVKLLKKLPGDSALCEVIDCEESRNVFHDSFKHLPFQIMATRFSYWFTREEQDARQNYDTKTQSI